MDDEYIFNLSSKLNQKEKVMKVSNQEGFGVVGVLIIVAVVGVVGFAGWRAYDHKTSNQDKVNTQSVDSDPQPLSSTESTETKKSDSVYKLDSIGATFSYPSDWSEFITYPNGVALKSPDFASEQGFRKISSGSVLTVASDTTPSANTNEALTQLASLQANGQPTTSRFITVGGQNAIEFTHASGENRNQHLIVLFVKDGRRYVIEQEFKLGSQNPYPSLINSIVTSLKFNN